MSRARARKQEEKKEFLQENPQLIEYDTVIGVGNNPDGEFTVDARDGLGDPLFVDEDVDAAIANEITVLDDFTVMGDGRFDGGEDGGEDAAVTLGPDGIGVQGEDEYFNAHAPSPVIPDDAFSIDEGETLEFDLETQQNFVGNGIQSLNGPTLGFTDLLIEYKVLNDGAGDIELELEQGGGFVVYGPNLNSGPPAPINIQIGTGQSGTTGEIEVDAPMGMFFGGFDLTVEGDVEIVVTGISYGSDFSLFDTI